MWMHIFGKNLWRQSQNPCDSNVVQVPVEAPKGIKPIGVSWCIRGTIEQMDDSFPIGVPADSCPLNGSRQRHHLILYQVGVCPVDWCSINWCTLISVLRREKSTKFITYYTMNQDSLSQHSIVALGSFTGMGFHFTIDINSKMNWCFFISRLASKENINFG